MREGWPQLDRLDDEFEDYDDMLSPDQILNTDCSELLRRRTVAPTQLAPEIFK